MTIEEQANALYALGAAFASLGFHTPQWQPVRMQKAVVGDFVIIRAMRKIVPIEQVGKLVADERVRIPEWGPIETWDPGDREEHLKGGVVGTQREWEIECLDGVRRRFTNVDVVRLPTINDAIMRY